MQSVADAGVAIVLRLLLVVLFLLALRLVLPMSADPARPALLAILYASGAVAAMLLVPAATDTKSSRLLAWCAMVSTVCCVILVADPVTRVFLRHALPLVAVVFLLGCSLCLIARRLPVEVVLSALVMAALAPVWAGPLVELLGNPEWLNRIVVYVSPLTTFAVALDVDYLRASWFYENSAIGSMRYHYPGLPGCIALLALLPIAALIRKSMRKTSFHSLRFAGDTS